MVNPHRKADERGFDLNICAVWCPGLVEYTVYRYHLVSWPSVQRDDKVSV